MRRVLVTLGLPVTLAGLAFALVPSLATTLSTSRSLVVLAGTVATVHGIRELFAARRDADGPAIPPRVEGYEGVSVPGREFDRSLAAGSADVRERLYDVAVDVLADSADRRSVVEQSLDRGDWTDDERAAAFFSATVAPPTDGIDTPDPRRQARHVVRELGRSVGRDWDDLPEEPPTELASPAELGDEDDGSEDRTFVPRPGASVDRGTGKWAGLVGVALVAGGTGAAAALPSLLLVGGLATAVAGVVAVHRVETAPTPSLSVSRSVTADDPDPGDEVTVTTTVRNEGDTRLRDLRFVDGVPPAISVTGGTARRRCALAPGESTTLSYEVRVERGGHEFRPAHVVVGDRLGARETVARAGDRELAFECDEPAPSVDPGARRRASSLVGLLPSSVGGDGVEFHSLREYRRGDPLSSVDWNRLARTGDLATLRFTEERRASVVVVVDARPAAFAAPDDSERAAVQRCVEAADAVIGGLLDRGHAVGLTALSATDEECWVPPRSGGDHRIALRRTLATSPAVPTVPPDGTFSPSLARSRLLGRFSESTQVVLCSPLVDDYPAILAQTLEARSHPTTVVAPDPTGDATAGRRLATVERLGRASDLRSAGIPVYDWARDESLALSLARHEGGRG